MTIQLQTSSAIDIKVSRSTVGVGSPVLLDAVSLDQDSAARRFRWSFSDGQTAEGERVSVTFSSPGLVQAKVEALVDGAESGSAVASIVVLAAGQQAPASFNFPERIGDVSGDGTIGAADALLLAQVAKGTIPSTEAVAERGDLDLDGGVGLSDLRLAMRTVLGGDSFPSEILQTSVYPGAVVAVLSPALFEADSILDVRVGGVVAPQVLRAVLGYASFIVPSTLAPGSSTEVELIVNGAVADRFLLDIQAPVALPADARADVLRFIDQAASALDAQQEVLTTQFEDFRLSAEQERTLTSASRAGRAMLADAATELRRLFAQPGGEDLARLFQRALYANGLAEFRSQLIGNTQVREGKLFTPDQICDVLIPGICSLKRGADVLDTAGNVISGACTAASAAIFAAGAIFPADGPAIEIGIATFFVKVCIPLQIAPVVGSVVSTLVEQVTLSLSISAVPASLKPGETARVTPQVRFLALENICGFAAGTAADKVVEILGKKLGGKIVAKLLKNNTSVRVLADIFARFGEKPLVKLLETIQESVGTAVGLLPLTDALAKFVTGMCPNAPAGSAIVSARRVLAPLAANEGSLQFNADGTATYACPMGSGAKRQVSLQANLALCDDDDAQASAVVSCALRDVVITMGDNGNALDDIFEVVVAGRSVLTSSAPVRSVSATVPFPTGRTQVLFRGLAAPDGIGTYFIRFSGATVVGGDSTSGTDLTPGTTKQYTVEVQ